jgi:L-fuculose-phosphate aldolase
METIEHFAKISLVARLLGREHLISRDEVERLQGLRGSYGIAAPAPLCTDPAQVAATDQVLCQILESPESPNGRLVPDVTGALALSERSESKGLPRIGLDAQRAQGVGRDTEIRLTYGELTALIEDAIRNLRD